MSNHLVHKCEPAFSIVERLGGAPAVADWLKVKKSVVYRFSTPVELKGRGGKIPHWYHDRLLAMARHVGRTLTKGELEGDEKATSKPKTMKPRKPKSRPDSALAIAS